MKEREKEREIVSNDIVQFVSTSFLMLIRFDQVLSISLIKKTFSFSFFVCKNIFVGFDRKRFVEKKNWIKNKKWN